MTFTVSAAVRARDVEVEITVGEGETVALLGPNGSGKSTILALAAGLLTPDRGRATLGGRVLFDVGSSGRRTVLPAWKRGVSLLAQDALLFPHLSVRENVAFGPRSAGASPSEARRRADSWLDRVDAAALAERRPAELSGGQAQRVAVARALATEPDLLLLDEPMAALDVSVAPAIRRMLREVLADRTAIIVTHDVLDAYTLADRVVVLEGGRVVDSGETRAVLDRPVTTFAAGLSGLVLLVGTSDGGDGVVLPDGTRLTGRTTGALAAGAPAGLAVRPSSVRVRRRRAAEGLAGERRSDAARPADGVADRLADRFDSGSTEQALAGTVADLEPRGDTVRVRASGASDGDTGFAAAGIAADLPPGEVADLDLQPGAPVWFAFTASDALVYPL